MDERSFRWFRASVILSGLTIIVVLANSATNYERRSTETEEIANLQTRMKVLEDQHQTDQASRLANEQRYIRRNQAQDDFNEKILELLNRK